MSVISSLPAGIPAAQPVTVRTPKASLDQGDFLQLLTAQLKNQDPTKPVDNLQYVQQMAMFSQIAATTDTNTQLTAIADRLDQLIALSQPAPLADEGA
jgi:flagellar basal-body rod modification protein FlgD